MARTQTPEQQAATRKRNARKRFWKAVGTLFTNRSRDLAIGAIVAASFVAVFDGALYSATAFAFVGWSAIAFALMPDALMVVGAAKMREAGITPTQHKAAKRAMHFGLAFSLFTNMVAAFLRYAPKHWITEELLLIGAIVYHGVVVIILWLAVEALTKTKADRKAPASRNAAPAAQPAPAKRKITKAPATGVTQELVPASV